MEHEPRVPDPRRVVASYDSYPEAQRAVDYLSDERFPVERVAIVAEGLRIVEQVTGRMRYGRAALQGAGSGAAIGLIFGFFLGLFSFFDPLVSALYLAIVWLVYGAIIGLLVGLISHALSGGQRDFSSVEGIRADRYNVMADEEVADEASQLLGGLRAPSGDAGGRDATERPSSRMGEESGTSRREGGLVRDATGEVSLGDEPATGGSPLSEERPERGRAAPSPDSPREAPPPSEGQPRRPGEELPPRAGDEPPKSPPPAPPPPPS